MIARDATPLGHVSPYRRIDPAHPGRKAVITGLEVVQNGGREPDAAIYRYNGITDTWYLKDGV